MSEVYYGTASIGQECLNCRRCAVCETRHSASLGRVPHTPEVMLVRRGPGVSEDEQGLALFGRSGQLLDHYLEAVDLSRDKTSILPTSSNAARRRTATRCRRNPPRACRGCQQFQLIRPKIVVCLGRVAAQQMMLDPGFSISRDHGRFFRQAGHTVHGDLPPAARCAAPSTSPLSLATLWPCGRKITQVCEHTY